MAYFPSNLNGPGALSLGFRDNRKLLIGIRTGPGGFSSQYKRGCQHRMSRRQRQVSTCRCFFDAQEAGYEHRCTHRHRLRQAPAPGRNSTAVRRYLLEIARNCPACCGSTQHNWCSTNCGSPGSWMPCRLNYQERLCEKQPIYVPASQRPKNVMLSSSLALRGLYGSDPYLADIFQVKRDRQRLYRSRF